jgi:dTMP kinase
LSETLSARGFDVVATREPGGTEIGTGIRSILLDSRTAGLSSMTELALMFADRAQHVEEMIQPALQAGKIVLCDRYTDSTEAYQGYGRKLGSELVLSLHRELCHDLWPHLTLLLESEVNASVARARSRNEKSESSEGRFEGETAAFFQRVHDGFNRIAKRDTARVVGVHSGSIQSVAEEILRTIENKLPQIANRTSVSSK